MDQVAGHPKAEFVRQDAILDAVAAFYADRVFGPDRYALWAASLTAGDDQRARERDEQRHRRQRLLADLDRRQRNVLAQAQDCPPGDPFAAGLRQTYQKLATQRADTLAALADLDHAEASDPAPHVDDVALLDTLPCLRLNLRHAPDKLQRALYEITDLTVRLTTGSDTATITARIPADRITALITAAETITENERDAAPPAPTQRLGALRAPS